MPWIIRNAAGEVCGRLENKPGLGNLMPDGSPEVAVQVDNDHPDLVAFLDAQAVASDLREKKAAAISALRRATADAALVVALSDPNAPQEVKDYAAAKAKTP